MGERFRLLLVEDNPGDAQLAKIQLSDVPDHAFEIVGAPSLQQAIASIEASAVDGIILDLNLPDSTGIATLRRLRQVVDDVAIVVLSGNESAELRHLAFAEGAYDFISKNEPTARLLARSVLYALERHRAQSLHRQIQKLVSANPDAVIVVDEANIVRFVNEAAEELFGIEHGRLVGEHLGFSIRKDEAQDIEIIRNGEVRSAEIRVAEIEWAGSPGRLASIRDVTDQRRLAEQLRQSQKMEAVGLLAGGVAHDFNNLVQVMMGSSELIADEMLNEADQASPRTAALRDLIEELQQATERARALTTQLLIFSGRRPSDPQTVDLNQAVRDVYSLLRRTLPENIDAVILPSDSAALVLIDPGQLSQVILNLVVNARDALGAGGRIEIALSNLHRATPFETLPPGNYSVMRVTDNGSGIPQAQLEKIFEPFFTTKDPGKGTGLGLSTCRGIIRQANGEIVVESEEGRGTTFTVFLPCVQEDTAETARGTVSSVQFSGTESILVVEDDPAVSRMITRILQSHRYTIVSASNGEEAMRLLEQQGTHIDLVLSDVVMPQMGGRELADHIDRARPGTKILLMSGYDQDMVSPAPQEGRQFLNKPFLPNELLGRIRELLDGQ